MRRHSKNYLMDRHSDGHYGVAGQLETKIAAYVADNPAEPFTVASLLDATGFGSFKGHRPVETRAGMKLRELGFEPRQRRINGLRERVYQCHNLQ